MTTKSNITNEVHIMIYQMQKLLSAAVLMLAVLAPLSFGQETRATILGRVTDPSGAAIAGAKVAIQNEATNVVSRTESNGEGNFISPPLEPGSYSVTAEAPGFRTIVQKALGVRTGDRVPLDLRLQVGGSAESITVNAEASLLEAANADIAQVVDRRFLDSLYLPDRNPLSMLSLTAGVEGGGGRFADSSQQIFSINGGGGAAGNNEITIDGASVVMPRQGGSIASSPSGDNVQEMRIQTTMFDAAFGRSNGGVVSYSTRGGTNQPHGSFEGFYRNTGWNANTWTNNKRGVEKPNTDRQFYSGAFGGPVYLPKVYDGRNRTFFFSSAQYEKYRSGNTYMARTFTDDERKGDFSKTRNQLGTGNIVIFDPWTPLDGPNRQTRVPFPNAIIPASRIDATGGAMAAVYPKANLSGPPTINVFNWAAQTGFETPSYQFSQRFDHTISDNQRIMGRFGYMVYDAWFTEVPRGLYLAPIPAGTTPNEDHRKYYTLSLNDDYTFGPTFLATFRYNFGRYSSATMSDGNRQDPAEMKMAPAVTQNAMTRAWPYVEMGENILTLGNRLKYRANDSHTLAPTFTKLFGNHSIRVGGEGRAINWNEISPDTGAAGFFTFNNTFTRQDASDSNTGRTTGTSMASMLLGTPTSGRMGGPTPYSLRSYYAAWFAQDDWKVTPKLTLNIGVRYELETPYTERYNRIYWGFDPTVRSPLQVPGMELWGVVKFAGQDGAPRTEGRIDRNNFGPRFGFAYRLFQDTVIRGGYGLFYASAAGNLDIDVRIPPTYTTSVTYIASQDGNRTPYTTVSNPFPQGMTAPVGNSMGTSTRLGDTLSFLDPNRVVPYAQQIQFGIQQKLTSTMKMEANFVRMLSIKGMEGFNLNEKPDIYLPLGAAENTNVRNPFYGIVPAGVPLGNSSQTTQKQLWSRFPQYSGSFNQGGMNTGVVDYHSLQLNLEKRFSHGLSFMANYTGSKMMDNNRMSAVNAGRNIRGIAANDRAHLGNVAFVYDLPAGKRRAILNHGGVLSHILGGWTASGRLSLRSGRPLQITDTNGRPIRLRDASKSGSIQDRLGDQVNPATGLPVNPYFDTTAFKSLASQYTIPPDPMYHSELRGPGLRSMDASLIKRVAVREGLNVEARVDVSNLTNTPVFDNPLTNMATPSTFGVIQSGGGARTIQTAFRIRF